LWCAPQVGAACCYSTSPPENAAGEYRQPANCCAESRRRGDPGETDPIEIALCEGRAESGLTDLVPGRTRGWCTGGDRSGSRPAEAHEITEGNIRETLARVEGLLSG
jgi:hypothetical protein